MGGVLVEVHRERAIRNFKAIGLDDAEKFIDPYQHKGLFFNFENGDVDTDEFCRLLCEYAGKLIPREAIEEAWRSIIDPPLDYKLNYLNDLRSKAYKVFLLSNNNPIIISWAFSHHFISSGRSLSDYFDKLYLSYRMKCIKPDLKIFRMMIDDAGIRPAESIYVDDGEKNIRAAADCGMSVLHVQNGADWRADLTKLLHQL